MLSAFLLSIGFFYKMCCFKKRSTLKKKNVALQLSFTPNGMGAVDKVPFIGTGFKNSLCWIERNFNLQSEFKQYQGDSEPFDALGMLEDPVLAAFQFKRCRVIGLQHGRVSMG